MKIIHKNKKEDIKLLIDLGADYHGEDIVLTFSAGQYGLNKFVCSYVGGVQTNCVVNNSTVLCLLDNHGLSLGMLSVEIDIRVPDTQMPDGDFRHVTRKIASFNLGGEECSLELTNGASDYFPEEVVPESVINLLPTVIKGEPGKDADIEGCNKAIAAMVALTRDVEMSESKRAEAEHQRMDSEAKRIAAENERKTAENERAEAETQRAEAETLRTAAEDTRIEAENLRITKEAERTKAETARQAAETLRVSNETKRTESEAARSESENTRVAAETLRANAEKLRADAEKQRIVNENERKEAETARVNAEALRANDETARSNAETQRAEAERQRVAAEAARQTAESSRDEAETIRKQNEAERTQAETQRADAETERQQAEDNRIQNESERQEAEQERITNNEKCVTATNTALSAAQEATTAANNAMQVASTAEATIAKSEKAASDAAVAVETANTALSAAQEATTAANNATTDAANAAGEAKAAADRANEAADLVYNGEPVTITINVSTTTPDVSVSGLDIKVWFDGSKETTTIITTDDSGTAVFDCPALSQYTIEYPVIGGCLEIPETNGYGGLKTKTYNIVYQPLPESLEQLTIRIYKWVGNHQGTKFADVPVHLTIDGETTDYITDANGEVIVEIPFGKTYTYSVDNIEGLYLYANINSWTFTAGVANRVKVINYRDLNIGLFFVCQDGAEFTYQQFVDSGRDGSDAILVKIVNYEVASTGNIFGILIDDIADGTYLKNSCQWCVSNEQFTFIPLDSYSANGLSNTINIVNEGGERSLVTAAATYCLDLMLDYAGMSLQGFLPAVLQKYAVVANESELNEMLAYVRPNAKYNFTKFCDTKTWTSDQAYPSQAFNCGRSAGNNNKSVSNPVLPFYAF